jgi:hypothetical protein
MYIPCFRDAFAFVRCAALRESRREERRGETKEEREKRR